MGRLSEEAKLLFLLLCVYACVWGAGGGIGMGLTLKEEFAPVGANTTL